MGRAKVLPQERDPAVAGERPVEQARVAQGEPDQVVAWAAPVQLKGLEIRVEARTSAEQAHRGVAEEVPWAEEPVQVERVVAPVQAAEDDNFFLIHRSSRTVDMGAPSRFILTRAMLCLCLSLWLCVLTSITTASAQTGASGILFGEGKRDTLRDLTGVEVVVESLDVDGLSSSFLKSEIEAQLDQAGIRVLRNKERLNQPGYPYLYVRLSLLNAEPVHTYFLEISLNQTVTLTRYPSISTFAPTWWVHTVGVMSPLDVPTLQTAVHDYLVKFVQAYQAVNPPENATLP